LKEKASTSSKKSATLPFKRTAQGRATGQGGGSIEGEVTRKRASRVIIYRKEGGQAVQDTPQGKEFKREKKKQSWWEKTTGGLGTARSSCRVQTRDEPLRESGG